MKDPPAWDKIGPWTRLRKLGEGGFGAVYIGKRNSDGKLFVVKSVCFVPQGNSPDPIEAAEDLLSEKYSLASLINEIRTLKKLKSPYIVRYIGCGTSNGPPEMDGRLLLDCYLEYLPRGSLYQMIKNSPNNRLEEPLMKAYTKDILRALVYLHFNKLVHGDLKCMNILMDANNCKVADFGSLKDVRTSFFKKILFGTRDYRAPEVVARTGQTYASDIFSLGCTIVEMATGKRPGAAKRGPAANPYFEYNLPSNTSEHCKDFLTKCFAVDPVNRWTASALLNHPFITEPSSPGWSPYQITLDAETEANILQIDPARRGLIVPPNDLKSSPPAAPFSPIHVAPPKRRKMNVQICQNMDETDVAVPSPPAWVPQDPPASLARVADDKHSGVPTPAPALNLAKCPPPFKKDQADLPGATTYKSAPTAFKKDQADLSGATTYKSAPTGSTPKQRKRGKAAQAAIKRLSLAPQLVLAEMKLQKSEVASSKSCTYGPHKVEFPPVAQLEGRPGEDTDPLVVQICSEFGIPLPPEYQKWIIDPDYDPNAVPKVTTGNPMMGFIKRLVRFIHVPLRGLPP